MNAWTDRGGQEDCYPGLNQAQNAAFDQQVTQAGAEDAAMTAALAEVSRLRREIDDVDKQILSILGR